MLKHEGMNKNMCTCDIANDTPGNQTIHCTMDFALNLNYGQQLKKSGT